MANDEVTLEAPDALTPQDTGKDAGIDVVEIAKTAEGNAWDRAMKGVADSFTDHREGRDAGKTSDRAPGAKPDASATDDTKGPAADAKDGEATAKDGKPKDGPEDPEKTSEPTKGQRYVFVGADGKPVADGIQWPEGAKMRFTMDGRPVTVKSPDQLVTMAQRGAQFDKEQARSARLSRDVDSLSERVQKVNQVSQDVLLAALFGTDERTADEIRDALAEELAPFRDPRYREGQEALRKQAESEAADETASTEEAAERTSAIWSHADQVFEDAVAEFPYLEPGDATMAKSVLHQRYVQAHQQVVRDLAPQAKAEKWSARKYAQAVEEIAGQQLSIENLRAVMQDLNQTYERRLKGGKPSTPAKPDTPTPVRRDEGTGDEDEDFEAEADAHNTKVDRKLDQKRETRTLRGGGASVVGGINLPNLDGATYEQRQAAMRKEFGTLRR